MVRRLPNLNNKKINHGSSMLELRRDALQLFLFHYSFFVSVLYYCIWAILNLKSTPKMTPIMTPNSTPKKTPDSTPCFTTCRPFPADFILHLHSHEYNCQQQLDLYQNGITITLDQLNKRLGRSCDIIKHSKHSLKAGTHGMFYPILQIIYDFCSILLHCTHLAINPILFFLSNSLFPPKQNGSHRSRMHGCSCMHYYYSWCNKEEAK